MPSSPSQAPPTDTPASPGSKDSSPHAQASAGPQAPAEPRSFASIPHTPANHFALHFHAALYATTAYVRHMAERNGEAPDDVFETYPFLAHYITESLAYMPDTLTWDSGAGWWMQQIRAWEAKAEDVHLPLIGLADDLGVSEPHRLAFIVAGLLEEDARLGTLFADVQAPITSRRPTIELVGRIVQHAHPGVRAWEAAQALINAKLVDVVDRTVPRAEWVLRVPFLLWSAARGEFGTTPDDSVEVRPSETLTRLDDLVLAEGVRAQLARVPAMLTERETRILVVRGTPGSDRLAAVDAVAQALDRGTVRLSTEAAASPPSGLGAFCTLRGCMPVVEVDPTPGETARLPALSGYDGPIGVALGESGGLDGSVLDTAVTVPLPPLSARERRRHWTYAFEGRDVEPPTDADAETIVRAFQLPGRYLRRAGTLALRQARIEGAARVDVSHVRAACRMIGTQLLDTLADRIDTHGSWDTLVVGPSARRDLLNLEQRCLHRERLMDHLGPAFGSNVTKGVRALFAGPSGTGKTLAAKILAAELGMDLYRVDLAAIINKYIGETEKNLHTVLSTAEELDVILLLDEGDALLGRRTDVKSSNDRYANVETNYLLQRLEHYRGIVLVTTNLGDNIDRAFQRRMDLSVDFTPPEAEERRQIWRLHLPDEATVTEARLRHIATRCALTGGQIRNAALHATLLALQDDRAVGDVHLNAGVRSEYRKIGSVCPLDVQPSPADEAPGGVGHFMTRPTDSSTPSS